MRKRALPSAITTPPKSWSNGGTGAFSYSPFLPTFLPFSSQKFSLLFICLCVSIETCSCCTYEDLVGLHFFSFFLFFNTQCFCKKLLWRWFYKGPRVRENTPFPDKCTCVYPLITRFMDLLPAPYKLVTQQTHTTVRIWAWFSGKDLEVEKPDPRAVSLEQSCSVPCINFSSVHIKTPGQSVSALSSLCWTCYVYSMDNILSSEPLSSAYYRSTAGSELLWFLSSNRFCPWFFSDLLYSPRKERF